MGRGGNSGSQATTLIIRAIALGEVRLKDWFRVLRRELITGFLLGAFLGLIGALRIFVWPNRERDYGPHYTSIAITVAISIVGVVMWGSICGSMLPFLATKEKLDLRMDRFGLKNSYPPNALLFSPTGG